ncbi:MULTISPECIES: hypothetical protein [unclassified Streptomyces]|uniref:hypothetical protein n=1 Tax=unclassified Streptomyces TaxID=2593676 RepID=UPI003321A5D6
MSITLAKPGDDNGAEEFITPTRLYVSISQLPDGRVSGVGIYTNAPAAEEVHFEEPRSTVWTALTPDADDTDESTAAKILDLALSNNYRDDDSLAWTKGERLAHEFHRDDTPERQFLRTVEALVIRAGYIDAHTGMIGCQWYGLAIGEDDIVMKYPGGWQWAAVDSTAYNGWYEQPGLLAPADASPRRLANAIIDNLACLGMIPLVRLPLQHRARVYVRTFSLRPRLHRLAYRLTRITRTVRARITR